MGPIKLLRATLSNFLETKFTKKISFYLVCSFLTKFCLSIKRPIFSWNFFHLHHFFLIFSLLISNLNYGWFCGSCYAFITEIIKTLKNYGAFFFLQDIMSLAHYLILGPRKGIFMLFSYLVDSYNVWVFQIH